MAVQPVTQAQPVTQEAEPGKDANSCKVSVKVHSKFQARIGRTKRPSLKKKNHNRLASWGEETDLLDSDEGCGGWF